MLDLPDVDGGTRERAEGAWAYTCTLWALALRSCANAPPPMAPVFPISTGRAYLLYYRFSSSSECVVLSTSNNISFS